MLSSHSCFCLLTRLMLHHVALCGVEGPLLLGSVIHESLLSVALPSVSSSGHLYKLKSHRYILIQSPKAVRLET